MFVGLSLMWVGIMGLIVIYIYALIGFAFFRASFDPEDQKYCQTLYQCFVTLIRYGAVGELADVSLLFQHKVHYLCYSNLL